MRLKATAASTLYGRFDSFRLPYISSSAMQTGFLRVPPHQRSEVKRIPDRLNGLSIKERKSEKIGYFWNVTKLRRAFLAAGCVHPNPSSAKGRKKLADSTNQPTAAWLTNRLISHSDLRRIRMREKIQTVGHSRATAASKRSATQWFYFGIYQNVIYILLHISPLKPNSHEKLEFILDSKSTRTSGKRDRRTGKTLALVSRAKMLQPHERCFAGCSNGPRNTLRRS